MRLRLLAGLLLGLGAAGGASAQQPLVLRSFEEVSLAPAGDRVAAVERLQPLGDAGARARGPVVVRDARTGAVLERIDPCASCRYRGLDWAPDGKTLIFLAFDPTRGVTTLQAARAGQVQTLCTIEGVADRPRVSPDGATVAVLATVGAHKESGAVEAGAAQVGDIGALQVADERRIGVIPIGGGALRMVSPADTFVYEYDWRPDSAGFVATAAKGNGDDNWWIARLVAMDLAGGEPRTIAAPAVQMNFPRVTADGRSVMFIGGLMSDFGSVGGDLYCVPIGGGEPVDTTPNLHATFTSLAPQRHGFAIATVLRGERSEIVRIDAQSGAMRTLWSAPASLRAGDGEVSIDAAGEAFAAQVEDFEHAPEIWTGGRAQPLAPLTRENGALPAQTRARSVSWTSDGLQVQGWLLEPLAPAPGKAPMIVEVHGGPSAASTPRYVPPSDPGGFPIADWLHKGWYIFLPNPRGSYGQGEAFTRANVRDLGGGDLRDVLAGIDKVETLAPVDDHRLGLIGHSYGGYMAMWTVTRSQRFAAAIAGAGIANWISYYGENGIDRWMIPFFGASAYDDPAIYEAFSPITHVKAARTPMLIYVGERDVECPAPQSFEFWHALQTLGVPNDFVVYAGQGHAIRDPGDLADLRRRELAWFDRYLAGAGAAP